MLNYLSEFRDENDLRRRMEQQHPWLVEVPKSIAILGAAEEGLRLATICANVGIKVLAVVDDSPRLQGSLIERHRVQSSQALDNIDKSTPIIIASHITLPAMLRLKERSFSSSSPFAALQVLHPAQFPPHMFHQGWFADLLLNRSRYGDLAPRLADDESRRVLNAVLAYRLTLDPTVFIDVARPFEVYLAGDIFSFHTQEVFVDAGAYDGDTIRRFIEKTNGSFAKAYGFEPDPKTFARLRDNFVADNRVKAVNAGLWDKTEVLRFHNDGGRASILGEEGDVEVNVVALDEALEEKATFIKMNIEGAELQALRGSAHTLRRNTPKLAIAAYHRPSDLWQVAQTIDDVAPGYDLFLRQHRGGLVETVLYGRPR